MEQEAQSSQIPNMALGRAAGWGWGWERQAKAKGRATLRYCSVSSRSLAGSTLHIPESSPARRKVLPGPACLTEESG